MCVIERNKAGIRSTMDDARGGFVLLFTLGPQGQGMSSACDIHPAGSLHTKTCWKMLMNKHVSLQNSPSKHLPN